MNSSELRIFIRENIVRLLEEDTKFYEGDKVIVVETGFEGNVVLAKHPFYAVKMDKTGITKSYDFNDLTKDTSPSENNDFYGKYDVTSETELQESKPDQIIKLDGLLVTKEHELLSDILSDIRSIVGITIVRTEDVPENPRKSKLFIKIDPFPFKESSEQEITDGIKQKIRQIPGVKEFWVKPSGESTQLPVVTPQVTNEIKFRIK